MGFMIESVKLYYNEIVALMENVGATIGIYMSNPLELAEFYTLIVRWIFPVLSVLILFRCILPLLRDGGPNHIWGFLETKEGYRIPLKHWENSIGRSRLSDIVINLPFISRSHAVLSYGENGWTVTDLGSKGGVEVNGEKPDQSRPVDAGDIISFAGAELLFLAAEDGCETIEPKGKLNWLINHGSSFNNIKTLLLILAFQFLGGIQIYLTCIGEGTHLSIPLPFGLYILAECIYYFFLCRFSRKYMELELLIFSLCGLNLLVVAAVYPDHLMKQSIAIILGMIVYTAVQVIIKDLGRGRKFKYIIVVCALILILMNLTIGEYRFGAKNWIDLGFITFQPMEFVKFAFVLAGTATLNKLLTTRNLTAFIGFSGTCIGALIIIRDLGTSVVFFTAFLVIAFMRSGDIRTIALISSGAALGAFAVISFLPYIATRFQAWGHVWEYADTIGYQQTRTLIAAASGGLLGVGGGKGYLVGIPASDTDLVFGILCEEWGLIVALTALMSIIFLSFLVLFLMRGCKSSFYAISACGAASIFMIQTALNVFGSIDLLPLTGVTLPFISNGGSSMVVCWALLAFIKSADERQRPEREVIEEGMVE
ncbi:MAG: FtsW/RodA/SpoVE family cell cycle protein [Eubacteriales bacterium]|nr:FtsW/RodA/SpoVE family cell cycle protein [Eubacteriales bacterium]MDD4121993.1 FtsW/RodA/SpoVE family cell cycle protein [Eubacteriales bacterium]